MRIAIVAGGTLGHINPGLILEEELSKKHQVIFISSLKDKKFEVLNKKDNIYFVDCIGFNKKIFKNLKTLLKTIKAMNYIYKLIKKEKFDLVIGMGGYISGIAIFVANILKIKTIIHEQNKVMGKSNKLVLRGTNKILLSFDIKLRQKYLVKSKVVSNMAMFVKSEKQKLQRHILITSGSNGAKEINDIAIELINKGILSNYYVTLVTGQKYYQEVSKKIKRITNINIIPFTINLKDYIKTSNIIISRAGSSTIFESIGLDTVPILIPSSNVSNNHQYFNALEIKELGLGEMINKNCDAIKEIEKYLKKISTNYKYYLNNILRYKEQYSLDKVIKIIEEVD